MNRKPIKIALTGNPNCGKTTVFNLLTGSAQYVGNRAGVTVEKKEAFLKGNKNVIVTDLPGIYSLSPYSMEETVTRDYILDESPDVILIVADASSIQRSLYLASRIKETGIPSVMMLNMIDTAEKRGIKIDVKKLGAMLGMEICTAAASKGIGVFEAAEHSLNAVGKPLSADTSLFSQKTYPLRKTHSPQKLKTALDKIKLTISPFLKTSQDRQFADFYSSMLFERDSDIKKRLKLPSDIDEKIEKIITDTEKSEGDTSDSIIIGLRYDLVEHITKECFSKPLQKETLTEKADRILTGKYTAFPCFALIMTLVYYLSSGPFGAYLSQCAKDFFAEKLLFAAEGFLKAVNCAEWLSKIVTEGIIGGVGSVIGFLPQLALLFLMLALLEDIGYMSRAAFISDRFFRKFGLSGKSFIPMLIATGCGVPAVMSSRTVENLSQRRITIITSTFMPCGAKLPVIAMISTVFFGGKWWVAPLCYFMGVFSVLLSGLILKKTKLFSSADEPFVLDMPSYRLPTAKNILKTLQERCGSFLKRAGTTILLASVVIRILCSFGINGGNIVYTTDMENSILKNIGEILAVFFEPLGFGNWQSAVACVMGLLAKEELVGVFGVLSPSEVNGIFGSSLAAFSFLAFNLLCAPCIAAVSAIRKELDSPLWTGLALFYQTVFAYTVSFCIFNLGIFFEGGSFNFMTLIAFGAVTLVLLYAFLPKRKKGKSRRYGRLSEY
ncbi:MAG: ferrous iron transport protein B [Ruminiclostridium sp.]|nr:ferrous iron transport protein B [Ruminiclostridium sp.]